jgi:PEP-CTERM motif
MFKKLALLSLAGACVLALPAHADTIVSSTSGLNNGTLSANIVNAPAGSTPGGTGPASIVDIGSSPNGAWSTLPGGDWISVANSGSGPVVEPNGFATIFTDTFNLASAPTSASLYVLADDTTSVVVNGITIWNAMTSGPFPTCSATEIGCLSTTEGIFINGALLSDLTAGTNTISFETYQEGGSSYGLAFAGDIVATPEPSTFLMLGLGLAGLIVLGGSRRRRMVSQFND